MLLSGLVECVGRVRGTPRKLEKVALLGDLLRQTRDVRPSWPRCT